MSSAIHPRIGTSPVRIHQPLRWLAACLFLKPDGVLRLPLCGKYQRLSLQAGIEITREQDEAKAEELEAWLDKVLVSYGVLPMDARAFREWARLMHGKSDTTSEDAMIAATAIVHRLTVVTRNVSDFVQLGVELQNPFEGEVG